MDEIKLNVKVPFATLFIGLFLTALASLLVGYVVKGSSITDVLGTSGLGIAGTTLIYAALQFHLSNQIRMEELRIQRLEKSLEFMANISEPSMANMLRITALVAKELSSGTGKSAIEIVESDESHHAAVVAALNYLERLAIMVRFDAADESILRDFFSVPVRRTWHNYHDWIATKRQEWHTNDLFAELEWLADRWKKAA